MEENTKTSFNLSTNSYIDYFVKSTAEFDAFADFKPITRLGKVEAVEKYKELQDKGISCGIGIDIRNDLIFDTPDGSGITVLIRNEDGKDTLNIMGDSFIKELKSPDQHSLDVLLAFEGIYNEAKTQGLDIEEAPYIEEKKQELFGNLPKMTLVNGDIVVGSESLPQNNRAEEKIIDNIEIKPVSLEEILGVMEMRPEMTPEGKIKVFDLQRQEYIDNRSDLPPFDEDNWTFNNAGEVFERLDVYINDYYVHDMQEQLEEAGREITGDETLSDLCSIYKTELEKGNDKLSLSVLNLAMGIVNPETVIMFENEKKLEINQEKEIHPEFIILDADDKSISELKEHLADNGYDVKWQEKDAENSYVRFTCDIDDKEYIQTILEDRNIYYHSKMGLTSLGFDGKWVDDPLNVEIVSQEEFKHIQEEKERMLDSAERYAVIDEYLPDTEFFVNAKNMLLDINAWQEGIANFGTSVVELNKFCNKDFKTKSMVEVYAAELEKSLFNLAEACSNGNAFNKEHEIAEKVVKANNSKELFASLKESYMNKNEPIKEGDKVTVSLKTLYEYIAENEGTFLFNDRNCVKTLYGATIEVSDGSEEPKTSYYDLYAKDGTLLCCDGETLVYSGIEEKTGLHTFTNPNNESQYLITLSNEELSVASFGISFVTQRIKDGVEYNTLPSTSLSDFDHDKFKKLYSESYNRYYNAEDKETHAEQSENMKQFDFLMKYNKDFKEAVQALVAERHDPYSSDRECAAVVYSFRILGIDLTLSTMELADAICQEGYEQSASGFMTSFSFSEIAELAGRDEDWVRDNLKEICEALATHNDELLLDFNEREALAEPGELEINFCSVGEDYNELFKKDDNGRWIRKTDAELRMEGFENGVLGELSYDHHTFIDEQKINFLEFPKVFNTPKSLGLSEKEHFAYYQYELSLNQIKTIASAESDIVKIVEKNTDSPEQLDVHFVFDREHNKLSDFYIRYNKNNNTYTSSYVAGEVRESDISKNMQENLCKIFEKVFKINQEIQTGAAEEVQSVSLSDLPVEELREGLKYALNEVAQPLPEIDFTRENYNKLFPRDRLNTPIETVKIGAHQFEKLEVKDRKNLLQAVHDVLSNPDLIINEEKESIFGDMENSHVYAKSYVINEKTKAVQSVVVNIEDEYISISTHKRDISNVVNKIKKPDQLLFAAAKVRLLVEQHTKEKLSQSVVNPNRENEYIIPPQTNITQTPEKSSDEKSIDSFNIKGEKYSFSDAEALLKEDIAAIFEELDSSEIEQNLTLNGVKIYGNPEKDGKIKLLVEFDSKNPENRWSEDSLFNAMAEEKITFNGMEVDVNPITPEKSGTIEEYLSRLERLDAVSEAEAIEKQAELILNNININIENPKILSWQEIEDYFSARNVRGTKNEVLESFTESQEKPAEKELKEECVARLLENQIDFYGFDTNKTDDKLNSEISVAKWDVLEKIAEKIVSKELDLKPYAVIQEEADKLLMENSVFQECIKNGIISEPDFLLKTENKKDIELTAEDIKNAKALLPKEQYQLVLGYTQGEEGEHFKGIIKEISSKAEAIKGKREILTEDEKHPLAFKYIMGASSFYFSEWDGGDELYGYVVLNGNTQDSEWGYTSLEELKNSGSKDRNGFPVIPEMIFYGLEDTIEKQISVDYPELTEQIGIKPKLNHNEELISEFGKEIFETLQSRKLEQSAYNICCAAQFVIRTMDSSEQNEIFSIMKKCGCEGKNGKANTEDFLTEVVRAENNTASSAYDRKRLYEKINKACPPKKAEAGKGIHNQENDYEMEI